MRARCRNLGFNVLQSSIGTSPRPLACADVALRWVTLHAGWFCGAPPLVNKLRLRVKDKKGDAEWREVAVPRSVRALVLLNLQSYGGGRDLWGLSDNKLMAKQGFSDPIFDDGLIEVRQGREGCS